MMNNTIMELMNRAAEEIANRTGRDVRPHEADKMGVTKPAFMIRLTNSNIGAVVYTDLDMLQTDFDYEVTRVVETFNHASHPHIDTTIFGSRDYFEHHVKVGLAPSGKLPDFVTRPTIYEGIDEFLYIDVQTGDRDGTVKVRPEMLAIIYEHSVDEEVMDKAFDIAEQNTFKDTKIQNILEILGFPVPDDDDEQTPIFVITNSDGVYGAVNILSPQVKERFGGCKCIFIPSSIHEAIIIPGADEISMDEITQMVQQVNGSAVAPEEQLSNQAYEFIA